ncbi:hypothetical protein BCR33DRAFT_719089 [Rhizoclosmatium globosum]|uniref:Uncharacterized protein n=1 Tax=Rhizoclosmatium globosum TaxID=329046 RepID=A0A1Y2C3V7_9FUNG|nr:hypothetical protein BCR33DRAFT_719089 [Rhizoclosmatium globosum]|eukprot:ORY40985.1 hypothetical protein BCR33DRAFT_719089 [Rhizoclosmatium globosum]
MRVTHKAAAAAFHPNIPSSGSKRIPDWFSQQSTENLGGTGTINDVFALVVREDSSDEMSHLSSVVRMLRCLTAYHSVLSVRYETEVGLYPAGTSPPSAPHSPYMTLDTPMKIHGSIAVRSPVAASGSSYPDLSKQIPTKHQKSMHFADTDYSETSFIVSRERPASIMLPHATTSSLPSSKSHLDIPFTRSVPVTTILKTQSLNETKRAVEKSWGRDTYGSNQYAKNSNSYSQAPTAQYYTQRKDQFGRDTRENTSAWRVKTSDQRSRRDQENWNYQRRREFNQQPSGKQTSWKNGGGSYNYRPDHVEPVSSVASESTNDPKPTYASIVSKGQSEGVQQVAVKPVQAWRRGESRPTPYSSNINSNARTSWRDRKENVEPQGQWRKDRNWRSNNK